MKNLPFVLRFLAGSTPGVEIPLKAFAKEVVIGRSDEADLVLDDAQASRKHARLFLEKEELFVEDLGSTNGVFVNARKIQGATRVKEGDRVQCGSSLFKLTRPKVVEPQREAATVIMSGDPEPAAPAEPREPNRFSGAIDEIPMPDLLQVLSTAKKTGVLQIQGLQGQGNILIRSGQIRYALLGKPPVVFGPKALYRMIAWQMGEFVFRPGEDEQFEDEMNEPTDALLMEAMRQQDELARLQATLPARTKQLVATKSALPIESLPSEQAAVLRLIRSESKIKVGALLDKCPLPDLEVYQAIQDLMRAAFIKTELSW